MITCKYCGSNLNFIGEHEEIIYFHCNFCELTFDKQNISENKKRLNIVPEFYDNNYYQPTSKLLKQNTISLFHMLRDCRSDCYNTRNTLKKLKEIVEHDNIDKKTESTYKRFFIQYEELIKKRYVIENILLEKAGFIPDKITTEFLNNLVEQGSNSSQKPMYVVV